MAVLDKEQCPYCGHVGGLYVTTKDPSLVEKYQNLTLELFRCPDCDLIYTWPLSEQFVADVGSFFASQWETVRNVVSPQERIDKIWFEPLWRSVLMPPLRVAKRAFYKSIGRLPKFASSRGGEAFSLLWKEFGSKRITLLDVGCSDGSFVRAARLNGIESYGIDPFETMVELIRARGVDYVSAGLFPQQHGPLASYDAILFSGVVSVLPKLSRQFFDENFRLLNPGGLLLICEVNPDAEVTKRTGVLESQLSYTFTSEKFMQRASSDAGFEACWTVPCTSELTYVFHLFRKAC